MKVEIYLQSNSPSIADKIREMGEKKYEYFEHEKSFLDEIKKFSNLLRTLFRQIWKNNGHKLQTCPLCTQNTRGGFLSAIANKNLWSRLSKIMR